MAGVSGKNGPTKRNVNEQQSSNDFEAFVAQYICDAEVPDNLDAAASSQSVLPYELLLKVLDL